MPSPAHAFRAPRGFPVTGTQLPSCPGRSQAWHCPSQLVLQQTPSTQLPLLHSLVEPQLSPLSFFAAQVPAVVQNAVFAQSASALHVVVQVLAPVAQLYGAHEVFDVSHAPAPLQIFPLISPSAHDVAPQAVPGFAYARHAPAPSHVPSAPQEAGYAGSTGHSPSGSVSAAITPQTPSTPEPFFAAVQARHAPRHDVSQQTPSTQAPLVHWALLAHAVPFAASGTHAPALQWCDAAHCASVVHEVAHFVPAQT